MNKPPIIKQGGHLSTDTGSLDTDSENTQSRSQVLKAANDRIAKKDIQPTVTKSEDGQR